MTKRALFLLLLLSASALALLPSSFAPGPALAQPPNDNLASAITVLTPSPSGIAATGTNVGATTETNEKTSFAAADCPADGFDYGTSATVWYNWTAPSTGTFVFDTFGSNFDTTLAIYTGSAFPLTLAACREGSPGDVGPSTLALAATGGTTYRIQIGSFGSGPTGSIVLSIARGAAMYVNTTADNNSDDGVLTLREAMLLAIGGTGGDGVSTGLGRLLGSDAGQVLNGPGGAFTADLVHFRPVILGIDLGSTLPILSTGSDHISGIGATVEVDGQTSGFGCLSLASSSNAISGLTIRRCTTGVVATGSGNRIGGTLSVLERNVIRENGTGVRLNGTGAVNNNVVGNHIGTDAAGAAAGPGNVTGVQIDGGADNNFVGGTTAAGRNIISGNIEGVRIQDAGTTGNVVRGNYIGTNAAGSASLANASVGVLIDTGAANNIVGPQFAGSFLNERNIVSGNPLGVLIRTSGTSGNIVRGNYIGLAADGTTPIANGQGVLLESSASANTIGGSVTGEGNVISGNTAHGVSISSSNGNFVRGNIIGLDAGGTLDRGNGSFGVVIFSSAANNTIGGALTAERNVVSGNNSDGVNFQSGATGNVVKGNYIGTNSAGTAALANGASGVGLFSLVGNNNAIGGSAPGERNVISGNSSNGISIFEGSGHSVVGNYIGTNASGSAAIPNSSGVAITAGGATVGGTSPGQGNVISGNSSFGVTLFDGTSQGNFILGNRIGTNASGVAGIPNFVGVQIQGGARGNTIGNTSGGGSLIALNFGAGVVVDGTVSGTEANSIRGNSVHSNGGAGIDLVSGANNSVPAPAVTAASATFVSGSACPGCTIDVYSDAADEGRHYLGTTTASLGGFWSLTLSSPPPAANFTATATDNNSTSEFSATFPAELCDGLDNDGDGLTDEGYPNADGDHRKDCVDFGQMAFFPPGHHSTQPHGSPAPTTDCSSLPEDYDGFKDGDGCPEPDNDNDGKSDSVDTCPGNDSHMGADGALGVGGDQNHNGLVDGSETWASTGTSGNDDPVKTYEDYDGIIDTDGCHDSPCDDADGDSFGATIGPCKLFADEREAQLGTNPVRACAATTTPNDESVDPYPLDTDDNGVTDISDISAVAAVFGDAQTPSNVRYDLNLSGAIDISDISLIGGRFGKTCVPPGPFG